MPTIPDPLPALEAADEAAALAHENAGCHPSCEHCTISSAGSATFRSMHDATDRSGEFADDVARLLASIPASLRDVSGSAFYTGLGSWVTPTPLYLMGLNPGGDPADAPTSTPVGNATGMLRQWNYSAYRDEEWGRGRGGMYAQGQHPMQQAVLHVFGRLGLDPGMVPTSNLVFARSRQAHHVAADDMQAWAEECWPFHADVIERQGIRVVLCMGADAAWFVRRKVGAHTLTATFTEANRRRFKSYLWVGDGVSVVQAAHPSRSRWDTAACDITQLVAEALAR